MEQETQKRKKMRYMKFYKDLLSDQIRIRQTDFECSDIHPQIMEARYLQEDQLLEYISQGKLHECLRLFKKGEDTVVAESMKDIYNRYPGNPLRSYKNSMISLNTMCRMAARRGGVTAFVVSSVSYKYALTIEGSSSVEFLRSKVTPVMLSDYCILVRDYSTCRYSPRTKQIVNYILDHLPSPLSVNQLSEEFYLNPSSLSRKFKKETGFSVTEFINQHRVKLAQFYLEQGYHSISEVACLVGYSDCNYFCRIFKKLTSLTPSQYIKNIRTSGMLI